MPLSDLGAVTSPAADPLATHEAPHSPAPSQWSRFGPWLVVAATIGWCLYELRGETTVASYLNDGAIHAQMVRFAVDRIREGHLPLTSWYPYLGEGSPQFLHYQSLGATLTALLGLATGANAAYADVLYILLATWPLSVYWGARLFGIDRWPAAASALCSPLIFSVLGIGYEQQSYLYLGFGLWSQLFAMWTLPLAWGFGWRAVTRRGVVVPAVVFVTLTMAFHFLTGYLAVGGVLIFFFVRPSKWRERIRPLALVAAGVAVTSVWFVVPLLRLGGYASINEFLINGPDSNSYGARQVLDWLVTGKLFDSGRLPVLTVFLAIGILATASRARRCEWSRAILILFVVTLLLFFGRPTFGPLFDLLPGNRDLFLRRFLMGVQLSGILLVGVGLVAIVRGVGAIATRLRVVPLAPGTAGRIGVGARVVLIVVVVVIALRPAWTEVSQFDSADGYDLSYQHTADFTQGVVIAPLLNTIRRLGGGRVYAGLPVPIGELGGWGSQFTVGAVPVVKYLAAEDIDEVGFTARTASLMTDPEVYFDEADPSDYQLFAVRYLLLPANKVPPVPATLLQQSGAYTLWTVKSVGYIQVVDTQGTVAATRANIGAMTEGYVHSDLAAQLRYPTVAFGGRPAGTPTLALGQDPATPPGAATDEQIDLDDGTASATVTLARRAVVLLKSSYDPGWTVRVDGHEAPTEMIAPAYVGVALGPGHYTVTFTYKSYGPEGWLLVLGGIGLVVMVLGAVIWRRRVPGSLIP